MISYREFAGSPHDNLMDAEDAWARGLSSSTLGDPPSSPSLLGVTPVTVAALRARRRPQGPSRSSSSPSPPFVVVVLRRLF